MVDSISLTFIALILGWIMDFFLGDPEFLPHPIVYFGKWISFWEKRLNKNSKKILKGAILSLVSIAIVYIIVDAILSFLIFNKIVKLLVEAILIFFSLSGHTLRYEVKAAFEAATRNLEQGRKQIKRIVGRDTQNLSSNEIRTASLETLAENLSDGIIAPLFFLAILGVPGMLAYKMINTLDSMLGYKNERFKDFGLFSARIDDVANFIPSKITACLIMIIGWIYMKLYPKDFYKVLSFKQITYFVLHYGKMHSSPNAGWPEAALSGILSCRFGGTHSYFGKEVFKPAIGSIDRLIIDKDLKVSLKICFIVECISIAITAYILY